MLYLSTITIYRYETRVVGMNHVLPQVQDSSNTMHLGLDLCYQLACYLGTYI